MWVGEDFAQFETKFKRQLETVGGKPYSDAETTDAMAKFFGGYRLYRLKKGEAIYL